MPTYLLSCACGATVAVGPGNAGGVAACPRCNAQVAVPRLGELARLPTAAAAAPAARPWTAAHACVLGGGLTAALALAAAAYLAAAPQPPFDEDTIRRSVAAAGDLDIYLAWQALSRSGVARPSTPDEERVLKMADAGRAVATVLAVTAAAAAVIAAGGWVALSRPRGRAA